MKIVLTKGQTELLLDHFDAVQDMCINTPSPVQYTPRYRPQRTVVPIWM